MAQQQGDPGIKTDGIRLVCFLLIAGTEQIM